MSKQIRSVELIRAELEVLVADMHMEMIKLNDARSKYQDQQQCVYIIEKQRDRLLLELKLLGVTI